MRQRILAGILGFLILIILLVNTTKEILLSTQIIWFLLPFGLLKYCFFGNPDKILSAQKIRQPNAYSVESGGLKQAQKDFDAFEPKNICEYSNGTKVGERLNGVTICLRPGNATKFPSIEIQAIDGDKLKIRYK